MRNALLPWTTLVLALPLTAQGALRGNGFPSAYIENTAGVLGGNLTVSFGSPATPNNFGVLSISGGHAPFLFPWAELGGPIAIDPFDPAYQIFLFVLDANGRASVTLPLAPTFAPASAPPLFANALTFDQPTHWSVSRTTRIDWMATDRWEPVTFMATARQLHTATPLGAGPADNVSEVLIAGGATGSFVVPVPMASAELFSPVTRATTALPSLSLPRSMHRAERLLDGRVLLTGGATTGGVITATCEFFDPLTLTFAPAPAMNQPRAGHGLTLLDDGRVLATGGVADWQNAAANFIAALNTAQASAEIYDPATNTWTNIAPMSSRRLGHGQIKLPSGDVAVLSGIAGGYAGALGGGQVPTYTTTCELFHPATNTWTALPPLVFSGVTGPFQQLIQRNGSAFSGVSLLPGGDVLVTGGWSALTPSISTNDASEPHNLTRVLSNGVWSAGPPLPQSIAFHTQVPVASGALVMGGVLNSTSLTPTGDVLLVDASQVTSRISMLGVRGMHTATPLADGTVLVYGGGFWPATLVSGEVYQP